MTVLCTTTATKLKLITCEFGPRARASGRVVREKWGRVDTLGCIQRLLSDPGRLDSLEGIAMTTFGKEVTSISRF